MLLSWNLLNLMSRGVFVGRGVNICYSSLKFLLINGLAARKSIIFVSCFGASKRTRIFILLVKIVRFLYLISVVIRGVVVINFFI